MKYQVPEFVKNKNITFCEVDDFLMDNFPKENSKIILLSSDHLNNDTNGFVSADQRHITKTEEIIQKTSKYKNYDFTVIHSCLNIETQYNNCKFIHWAPEWLTNKDNFSRLSVVPQSEKNFNADYFWISLNRNKRVQRYLSGMYVLGQDFEKHGYLTLTPEEILEHESFDSWVQWWNYNEHYEINSIKSFFPVLEKGFNKIKNNIGYKRMSYNFKDGTKFIVVDNFTQFLKPCYANSLVEIVNETIWFPDIGGIVSEKFVNSVYGYNLPIVNGVQNTIQYLKKLGFELFEDIIDHSYDNEPNHVVRLINALDKNKEILADKTQALAAWKHCKSRMDHNVKIVQELEKNAEQKWIDLISNL
jgi:hypothetical protein